MSEMTGINLPLAKGVVKSFDAAYEDLCRLALLTSNKEWQTVPEAAEAKTMFDKIDENTTEKYLSDFFYVLQKIPSQKLDLDFESGLKDFCSNFKRFRDAIERKLSTSSHSWLEIREKERTFPDENKALSKELKNLEEEIGRTQLHRKRRIADKAAEKETAQGILYADADFKSQHPFFLKANTKEQLEFMETCYEKKLVQLRKKQEQAEKNYLMTASKHRMEIRRVIEETVQTKAFIEWLKEKNRRKMKNYQEKLEELWNKFKEEMQQSEELCRKYKEVNEVATKVLTEKKIIEDAKKRLAATLVLQKHIRQYLAKKKEESDD